MDSLLSEVWVTLVGLSLCLELLSYWPALGMSENSLFISYLHILLWTCLLNIFPISYLSNILDY